MSQVTHLAGGALTCSGDTISIELYQPDSVPAVVRIVWPTAPTITTLARYTEVASTAMRLLAEASTALSRIKASKTAVTGSLHEAGHKRVTEDQNRDDES
jgi:hypothetical protein